MVSEHALPEPFQIPRYSSLIILARQMSTSTYPPGPDSTLAVQMIVECENTRTAARRAEGDDGGPDERSGQHAV